MTAPDARQEARDVVHEVVHLDGLQPVYDRPHLAEYLRRLWHRRHFIWADSRARVVSGTRGNLLGTGWLVLQPILDGAVFYLMFGVLLKTSGGVENFIGYLIVGMFLFQFTTRCVSGGASSLLSGRSLIRGFTFPRAALPVAVVVRETITMVPVLGAMFVLVLSLPPRENLTWRLALFPAVIAIQIAFNLSLALIAARATAQVPDLQRLIGFLMRFWLYGSAVFFSYERFITHPLVLHLMRLNPMFVILDISRDVLLYGRTPELGSWLLILAWAVGALVVGVVYFWRGEERYGAV
jgi:teichoic acid transport system permease protein